MLDGGWDDVWIIGGDGDVCEGAEGGDDCMWAGGVSPGVEEGLLEEVFGFGDVCGCF